MQAPDGWKLFVGALPTDVMQEELQTVFSTYGEVAKIHVMPASATGKVAAFVYYVNKQPAEDAMNVLNNQYRIRADALEPIQVRWANPPGGGKDGAKGAVGAFGCAGAAVGFAGAGYDKGMGKGLAGAPAWQGGMDPNANVWAAPGGFQAAGVQFGGKGAFDPNAAFAAGGAMAFGGKDAGKGKGGYSETKLFVGNLPEDITDETLKYVFSTYGAVNNVYVMTGRSKTGNACAFVEMGNGTEAETAILTLNDKYEIKPGAGTILVKKANASRPKPY